MSSIKELIQKCIKAEMPTIDIGVVTIAEPLRVTLQDDAKINISQASMIIPSGKSPLKQGEKVYLLSLNRNKIYYVLDRV